MSIAMQEKKLANTGLKDINPVLFGTEACSPGQSFGPAVRRYYLLHFVVKGKGTYENQTGRHPVVKNQIFVIRPGDSTVYTASKSDPWEYVWIGFESGVTIDAVLRDDVITAPLLKPLFLSMLAEQDSRLAQWCLAGKIYDLLVQLGEQGKPVRMPPARYADTAAVYIQEHYQSDVTVSGLAASLGLERSYFCRLFKRRYGISPQQYLVEHRMLRAAELLASRFSPSETAKQVGYQDLYSFSKMFKRRYGVPPSRYREA